MNNPKVPAPDTGSSTRSRITLDDVIRGATPLASPLTPLATDPRPPEREQGRPGDRNPESRPSERLDYRLGSFLGLGRSLWRRRTAVPMALPALCHQPSLSLGSTASSLPADRPAPSPPLSSSLGPQTSGPTPNDLELTNAQDADALVYGDQMTTGRLRTTTRYRSRYINAYEPAVLRYCQHGVAM
ncbi:hypothetical protein FRC12_001482 [Ceratobasidium sp. 428]|nr:hypothetical protein FRC12_001482 [Ceratobasidium sp. 428]